MKTFLLLMGFSVVFSKVFKGSPEKNEDSAAPKNRKLPVVGLVSQTGNPTIVPPLIAAPLVQQYPLVHGQQTLIQTPTNVMPLPQYQFRPIVQQVSPTSYQQLPPQ